MKIPQQIRHNGVGGEQHNVRDVDRVFARNDGEHRSGKPFNGVAAVQRRRSRRRRKRIARGNDGRRWRSSTENHNLSRHQTAAGQWTGEAEEENSRHDADGEKKTEATSGKCRPDGTRCPLNVRPARDVSHGDGSRDSSRRTAQWGRRQSSHRRHCHIPDGKKEKARSRREHNTLVSLGGNGHSIDQTSEWLVLPFLPAPVFPSQYTLFIIKYGLSIV